MKVILHKDIAKVGHEGEVVSVADGFARNYLFPRGLAVEAAGGALKAVQLRQALEERRSEKLRTQAETAQGKLDGKTVSIAARAGAGDRLYGSITAADVAEAVQSQFGIAVDKRKVQLLDPIKALGTFSITIKLYKDIAVPVTVQVTRAAA